MEHCENICTAIQAGKTALGIELGSTRIKAVLIDENHNVLASGQFSWENRLENGLWTYSLKDAITGLQKSYAMLANNVRERLGTELVTVGAIGISGMMHGYLALDAAGRQLAPFLTWRNTNTAEAGDALTELFHCNVPLRWSIAQLYQAVLNHETHVAEIAQLTTLAGYVHFLLTGERVLGIGDAAGMFPIDYEQKDFDAHMLAQFDALTEPYGYSWKLREILPKVLTAGQHAGRLTEAGAKLLDPHGKLRPGIPFAPPEGDAATGMVATDSVAEGTGNVSAGTSIFSMVVLKKKLSRVYRDIDLVSTPSGRPVAMIHCNNGTSELDTWMRLFAEVLTSVGAEFSTEKLYTVLFQHSLQGDADGILLYNYVSGEPITGLNDGRPLLVRKKSSRLSLANFMRVQIFSVLASLAVGMRILKEEGLQVSRLTAHGGLFRTAGVAQRFLAAAMGAPVTVMQTASEGGPFGMALLALYLLKGSPCPLEEYLHHCVFSQAEAITECSEKDEIEKFAAYLQDYCTGLQIECSAVMYLAETP